jgi:cytochrome bd ubiquinol oxidase subunit I
MPDLVAARTQMALSLGWHIVLACFGVGFPIIVLLAEWRGIRTGEAVYGALARQWARVLGVLFAVGAVSGTILSFELGILWPRFMGRFGEVIGLPFAMEGIAFFIEAIFVGLYLYGWDRLRPSLHLLSGLPIVVAGIASAWFVVTANAWMNEPTGFRLDASGRVVDPDPWAAMLNPATPVQTTHMILAAIMVAAFGVAAVYAAGWLQGRRDPYHRLGFLVAFTLAALVTPVQIGVGDWAARFLADRQPVKLAALEGLQETLRGAPLTAGGIYFGGKVHGGIRIPKGLSLLAQHNPDAVVYGLDEVPPEDRPPVAVVRNAFQFMVAIGTGLLALSAWFALAWVRRRRPPESAWFYRAAVLAGIAAPVALEAGWITTEVGRQPWIVYRIMRVEDAVTTAPRIRLGLYALVVIYALLTWATVFVVRRLTKSRPDAVFSGDTPGLPAEPRP